MEKLNYWEDTVAMLYFGMYDDDSDDDDYRSEGEA